MTNYILSEFRLGVLVAVAVGLCLASPTGALCASIDPLLHYSFDSADVSGTTVTDLGTGGNDGTIIGTVNLVPGTFNQAASIVNGGSNYISSGTALLSTSNASQPYTILFWMQSNGRTGAPVSQYNSGDANRFLITNHSQFSSTTGELVWWHGNSGERGDTGATVSDNIFHHVAFVKDSLQNLSIYLDGDLVVPSSPTTDPRAFMNANFEVGRGSTSVHGYTGLIDELFVFDQALTSGQIHNLYAVNAIVPEPSTLAMLLGLGGIALLGYLRRRRRS